MGCGGYYLETRRSGVDGLKTRGRIEHGSRHAHYVALKALDKLFNATARRKHELKKDKKLYY